MKKKLGVAKQLFQELACLHSNEIKAKDAYPCIKYHILETIARKELSISYIVADLKYIKPALLEDKNILYMDSDDRNAYPVQAADYVANALYGWYEYNDKIYYDRFKFKIRNALRFPYKNFGK